MVILGRLHAKLRFSTRHAIYSYECSPADMRDKYGATELIRMHPVLLGQRTLPAHLYFASQKARNTLQSLERARRLLRFCLIQLIVFKIKLLCENIHVCHSGAHHGQFPWGFMPITGEIHLISSFNCEHISIQIATDIANQSGTALLLLKNEYNFRLAHYNCDRPKNHLEAIEWWWKSGKRKHYNFIQNEVCFNNNREHGDGNEIGCASVKF